MALTLTAETLQDELAVLLACMITVANKKAREMGIDVAQSLVTILQETTDDDSVWRVNYGPKKYIGQRGGDITIEVNAADASIRRVLRGQ